MSINEQTVPSYRSLEHLQQVISGIRNACTYSQSHATNTAECVPQQLQQIIRRIREAALRDFKEHEADLYAQLLRGLRNTGVPLAALSVCGHGTMEIRYTKLLAYFLTPSAPHGLGSALLKQLVLPELSHSTISSSSLDFDAATVVAEKSIGKASETGHECIVDIWIHIGNVYILVEQKIHSAESREGAHRQLQRYTRALARHYPHVLTGPHLLLFLTPAERVPSEDQWFPIMHGTLFQRFASLLDSPDLSRIAKHNLGCLLWDLLMGPMSVDDVRIHELMRRIDDALQNPARSFALKQWCANNIGETESRVLLHMMEVIA